MMEVKGFGFRYFGNQQRDEPRDQEILEKAEEHERREDHERGVNHDSRGSRGRSEDHDRRGSREGAENRGGSDIREETEFHDRPETGATDHAKPHGRRRGFVTRLLSGSVISDSIILKDIRYSALVVILTVLFIANRYNAERLEREITLLEQEVQDLRAESLSVSAELVSISRQSEIGNLVRERGLGLEELREPPYRIVTNQ